MRVTATRRKQNLKHFDALAITPADLAAGVVLPAAAKMYVSYSVAVADVTPVVTVGSTAYNIPASAAGILYPIGYFERFAEVKKVTGAIGTASLYVEGALGAHRKIAEG